jgi:hypothetical protein
LASQFIDWDIRELRNGAAQKFNIQFARGSFVGNISQHAVSSIYGGLS